MTQPLVIDYYSDVLCVWAWIAQRRIDELNKNFGDSIKFTYRYVDIFGDVETKMQTQWAAKGGYQGFATHGKQACDSYDSAIYNPRAWGEVKPSTSANAHLVLKAVEINCGHDSGADMALAIRTAFFENALDISNIELLIELVSAQGLDVSLVQHCINTGQAIAALMGDYQQAKLEAIKGSPSYVLDGGRQTLYGNVGYRVLCANIEELLKQPDNEASWC